MTLLILITVHGVIIINVSANKEALLSSTIKTLEQVLSKIELEIKLINTDSLQAFVENIKLEDKKYIYLTDKNFVIKYHPDKSKIGTRINTDPFSNLWCYRGRRRHAFGRGSRQGIE